MTRRPKVTDDTAGQLSVVVAFRMRPRSGYDWEAGLRAHLIRWAEKYAEERLAGLDIAANVIGAQGETSMHEHPVGLATTEDVERVRARRDVPVEGGRL